MTCIPIQSSHKLERTFESVTWPGPSPGVLSRKRLIDLCLLALLAPLALVLVGLFAALIRLLTGGPGLYRQTRVGYRGRLFEVWKMRTMKEDAESLLADHLLQCQASREEWNRNLKLKKDPRIIPYLGSFLRKTSLDELPQVYNIWRGEMSFVGPRPLPVYHQHQLDPEFQKLRESVPPGLSGLWQIRERSDGDLESHQLWDTRYILNFSIANDLWILAQTPLAVLCCRGAR